APDVSDELTNLWYDYIVGSMSAQGIVPLQNWHHGLPSLLKFHGCPWLEFDVPEPDFCCGNESQIHRNL
ncbi:hypothetical protein HAX54_049716, partial [Datura stramonium]|nr:hypothetical protein [Datura stramonium]